MIKQIDILKELQARRESKQNNLLNEVKQWIFDEHYLERQLFKDERLEMKDIDSSLFSPDLVYSIDTIKDICIKYKLRFLDQNLFKEDIPYEAVIKIKGISKQKEVNLKRFKILAPAEKFSLKDPNADPILFARLNDESYLFIHKWGNDLAWYKKWSAFPFRNLKSLLLSILALSIVIASAVPTAWFGIPHLDYFNFFRVFTVFWTFVVCSSITSYLWFVLEKDFSSMVWDSKYL